MKKLVLVLVLGLSAHVATGHAQDADPLAVTLPNGRVVHFQTDEQKAKFVAAQVRLHVTAATPQTKPRQRSRRRCPSRWGKPRWTRSRRSPAP